MTLMTCVSEDIILQLFVLFWMFLKGTHGSWFKSRAPYPIPSYSGVCSGPSFLSPLIPPPPRETVLGLISEGQAFLL